MKKVLLAALGLVLAGFAFQSCSDITPPTDVIPSLGLSLGNLKVTICHDEKMITVAEPALAAHLAHGDAVAAPPGLVSWWPGDGNADDITDGNHGTLVNGASFASGMVGQAFRFDGVDDYVEVGVRPNLKMNEYVSIDAWIFPTGPGGDPVNNGGTIVNREGEYEIHRYPDGTIRWAFHNTSPGWTSMDAGFKAPENEWTHLAVVYDAGIIRSFKNGQLIQTFEGSGVIGDGHAGYDQFRIGWRSWPDSWKERFQGLIDEVEIFDRALTSSEVHAIFMAGSSGKCKPGSS